MIVNAPTIDNDQTYEDICFNVRDCINMINTQSRLVGWLLEITLATTLCGVCRWLFLSNISLFLVRFSALNTLRILIQDQTIV